MWKLELIVEGQLPGIQHAMVLLHGRPCSFTARSLYPRTTSFSTTAASKSTLREQGVAGAVLLQWRNPTDVLSILSIAGGDVVLKALAQLSGGRLVPVAFSFGWVI